MLTVYVDDFILAGPGSKDELDSIRNVVRATIPAEVGRVLGVRHKFTQDGTKIDTEILVDYVKQSCELCNSSVGSELWPFTANAHYPWYEPNQVEIDTLGCQPGFSDLIPRVF